MNREQESLSRFAERYATGRVPWDDQLPPPEVQTLVSSLKPGRALDLGCGYGRTAIYLARHGWQVDGVDFVPQAIEEARRRAAGESVAEQIQFHKRSVAELGFLNGRYDLAIDIGCMHSLSPELQLAYRDELLRLLQPGAPYLLFARLSHPEEPSEDGPSGMAEADLQTLFAPFQYQKSEIGVTAGDDYQWRSGWFWYVRK